MANKNICEREKEKKMQKIEKKQLKEKIEKTRKELNDIITRKKDINNNEQILEISEKLDQLIAEYLKNQ